MYYESFGQEQEKDTQTNVFVCKARVILSHLLKGTLTENMQVDMVYALSNIRIRGKVERVTSFWKISAEKTLKPTGNKKKVTLPVAVPPASTAK